MRVRGRERIPPCAPRMLEERQDAPLLRIEWSRVWLVWPVALVVGVRRAEKRCTGATCGCAFSLASSTACWRADADASVSLSMLLVLGCAVCWVKEGEREARRRRRSLRSQVRLARVAPHLTLAPPLRLRSLSNARALSSTASKPHGPSTAPSTVRVSARLIAKLKLALDAHVAQARATRAVPTWACARRKRARRDKGGGGGEEERRAAPHRCAGRKPPPAGNTERQ